MLRNANVYIADALEVSISAASDVSHACIPALRWLIDVRYSLGCWTYFKDVLA